MSNNQSLFSEITPSQEANLSGGVNIGTIGTNNGVSVGQNRSSKIASTPTNIGTIGTNNGLSIGNNV